MKKLLILIVALITLTRAMAQWGQLNSGTTEFLTSVYFTDENTGFVIGENGTILKTTDGGDNWSIVDSGT